MKLIPALALGLLMSASASAAEQVPVRTVGLFSHGSHCDSCAPSCAAPCEPSCCAPAEPSCCAPCESACCNAEPSCCAPCEPVCCAPAEPSCCAPCESACCNAEPSCCAPCEPSCAAPCDSCGSAPACCCRPKKKSLCDRIMDIERRKNRWLLGLVGLDD